ncbi:unnamed protein product [Polarella glacialis]|uniref:Uncharacterized protein n=1 Tax=Polarella glacialis TaxID=89957 RepID=A0A813FW42_POLGL|nr:unnamed protein product [Polarella glacialis]
MFDGEETLLIRSRDFHQISGRAGRKGFDTSGDVVAVDPDWMVHNRELQDGLSSWRAATWWHGVLQDDQANSAIAVQGQQVSGVQAEMLQNDCSLLLRINREFWMLSYPVLQQSVEEEDLPFALLAAAESMCDAPASLLRSVEAAGRAHSGANPGTRRPGTCPDDLEGLLLEVFAEFRQRHPWVPEGLLRPKGIALELVAKELSFAELAEVFGGKDGAAASRRARR